MRLIPHILYSLCLLLSTLEVQGQNVSIQAKIDRGEIRTGEQAAIDVVIRTRNLAQTKFYLTEDLRQGEPFVVLEFTPPGYHRHRWQAAGDHRQDDRYLL